MKRQTNEWMNEWMYFFLAIWLYNCTKTQQATVLLLCSVPRMKRKMCSFKCFHHGWMAWEEKKAFVRGLRLVYHFKRNIIITFKLVHVSFNILDSDNFNRVGRNGKPSTSHPKPKGNIFKYIFIYIHAHIHRERKNVSCLKNKSNNRGKIKDTLVISR